MGSALISLDVFFLQVNPALCQMLDRTEDEITGSATRLFTHPDDLSWLTRIRPSDKRRSPTLARKRYLRPDERIVWAETRGTVILDDAGRTNHIVSHLLDVTGRKLAEQQSVEASQDFEAAFTEAPTGMAIVALDGRFIKVNRTMCELTGYIEDQFQDLTFHELTHGDDLERHIETDASAAGGEDPTIQDGEALPHSRPAGDLGQPGDLAGSRAPGRRIAKQVAAATISTGDAEIAAAVSIGVALIEDHMTPAEALRQADIAMYEVKLRSSGSARNSGLSRGEGA